MLRQIVFISLIIVLAATNAIANTKDAEGFVQSVGDEVMLIISNEKMPLEDKEKKLENLFVDSVDISWIAKFVMGRYWRDATEQQKQVYNELYNKFLVNNYVYSYMY